MNNLQNFVAKLKDGIARPSQFTVAISPPSGLSDFFLDNINDLMLFCDGTALPGIEFMTQDIRITGEVFKAPFEKKYGEIGFNFYVDRNMKIKLFFDRWIELVQSTDNRIYTWPEDYRTVVDIYTFDKNGEVRYRVKLNDAYPIAILPILLNYDSQGIMRMQTIFAYRTYEVEMVTQSTSLKIIPFNFNSGSSGGGIDEYFGNIFI